MVPIPRDVQAREPLTPGADEFRGWPEERQLQVVGPTRLRLIRDGSVTLTDFVQRTNHPVYGGGIRTASIPTAIATAQARRHTRTRVAA